MKKKKEKQMKIKRITFYFFLFQNKRERVVLPLFPNVSLTFLFLGGQIKLNVNEKECNIINWIGIKLDNKCKNLNMLSLISVNC